jgi:hypothetical protein
MGGEVCMFAGGGLFTQSNMSASRGQFDTLINADIVAPASSNTPKLSRAHASMLKSGDLTSYPASLILLPRKHMHESHKSGRFASHASAIPLSLILLASMGHELL